jgi:hypothetical protein
VPGAGCAAGVDWLPLLLVVAAGVFAGAFPALPEFDPLDCAATATAQTNTVPARTAALKPMRSAALMTGPPPAPRPGAPLRSTS